MPGRFSKCHNDESCGILYGIKKTTPVRRWILKKGDKQEIKRLISVIIVITLYKK